MVELLVEAETTKALATRTATSALRKDELLSSFEIAPFLQAAKLKKAAASLKAHLMKNSKLAFKVCSAFARPLTRFKVEAEM